MQLEARYRLGNAGPFLFHDAGSVSINADPGRIAPAVTNNIRSIAVRGLESATPTAPSRWRPRPPGAPVAEDRNPTPKDQTPRCE